MRRSILIVAPYLPLPANFGGALRIYNLIRCLAEDHDVSLLAPGSGQDFEQARELGALCNVTLVPASSTSRQPASRAKRLRQVRSLLSGQSFLESAAWNPGMQSALERLLKTRRIDLVQYEFPESALYRVTENIPTIFDAHNVEHDLLARVARGGTGTGKQVFNMLESGKLRRLERKIWDKATRCLATSERDAELMRALTSTPVDITPNGVDPDYFSFHPLGTPGACGVVFTGAMRHQPNSDGARWYVEEVHERVREELGDASFSIVGADPPASVSALQSDTVTVTGQVDDVRPYLERSCVVAVPLWSGGGTRLKILEALAFGRPVVTTSIGAEGLDVRHGEHVLIADSGDDFSQAVVRLCQDRQLANTFVTAGRALIEERYSWTSITERLVAVHDRAIAGKN